MDRPDFFWQDGVHPLDRGLDIFLKVIKVGAASGAGWDGWWAWDLASLVPMLWQVVQIEQILVSHLAITGNV